MTKPNKANIDIKALFREGAINTFRGGCANLASFDPKMLTPPKNCNIGLDPP